MGIELRILGPLSASKTGEPVALGAPKQRALLAALALHRGEVVSRDRLVDELWGESPPAAAAQSLQVYVHGLRRALGRERIETHGTGYRLRVEPAELDLERFRDLVDGAREALAAGDSVRAAAAVDEALGLWRGPPLADLAGEPVAERHAAAVEELRLGALELRAEVELARGAHTELVPELERLVADHPFRERFREQLVLALYRCGRQSDALAAYRDARDTLAEELGVDPGPALRELERAILRHDPALAAPAPAPAPPRRLSLPAAPTPLVGRRLEVAAVAGLLRSEARLVTLTGPGGTGKTRIALAVAEELGDELPGGAVFVDLSGLHDPSLVGVTIAETLGVHEGSRSLSDALADELRHRELLLVLDNLEQLLPAAPEIGELLARCPTLRILATSRSPLRLRAEHEYPVPPLEPPSPAAAFVELTANDAVRLFAQRARAVDPAFELTEKAAGSVAVICARLDGLPLAIELAAARVKLLPPTAMATRLESVLDVPGTGARDAAPHQQTLRATLDWSYRTLGDEERRTLARLAVFSGGASIGAAEAVCDASLEALEALVDASLLRRVVSPDGAPRCAMLETIRAYASELLAASGEEEEYRRRHCEHFLAVAEEVARHERVDQAFFASLESDHDNMRAALEWAEAAGEIDLAARLAIALSHFWRVRGHLSEGLAVFTRLASRTEGAAPETRASTLVHGAVFAYRQGRLGVARAWWEEALALYRSVDDVEGATRTTAELGAVAVSEGDLDRARALYEEAAAGFEQLGNRVRLGVAIANLSAIASMQGDLEAAARHGSAAAALQEETGDLDGLAITLHNLARTSLRLGDESAAHRQLAQALEVARDLGYKELLAYGLEGVAEIVARHGDHRGALRYLAAAEATFDEIGVPIQGEEAEGAERLLGELETALGRPAIEDARRRARKEPADALVGEALALLEP